MHYIFEIEVRADLEEDIEWEGVEGAHQQLDCKHSGPRCKIKCPTLGSVGRSMGREAKTGYTNDINMLGVKLDLVEAWTFGFNVDCIVSLWLCS